jgi:hypothetical protein
VPSAIQGRRIGVSEDKEAAARLVCLLLDIGNTLEQQLPFWLIFGLCNMLINAKNPPCF